MKIRKITLFTLLCIFLFCFSVNAADYKYGVGVEALGFQAGQAYYGAGSGASTPTQYL